MLDAGVTSCLVVRRIYVGVLRNVTVLEPSSPPAGHQSASTLATGGVEVFAAVDSVVEGHRRVARSP
jgi:hypothetical protein